MADALTADRVRAATGRELDVMLAVRLFGWRLARYGWHPAGGYGWLPPESFAEPSQGPHDPLPVPAGPDDEPGRGADREVPEYSASWAGLGLVADRMKEEGWTANILMEPHTFGVDFWDGDNCESESDPDVGVAGCRAALLAILAQSGRRK
jgi:hypothetical protein